MINTDKRVSVRLVFYVHKNSARKVFVKTEKFFIDQGGLVEEWGRGWTKVEAESIENAREIGQEVLK